MSEISESRNLRVPVVFAVQVVLVLAAVGFVSFAQALGDDDQATGYPFSFVGLPALAVIAFLAWRALGRTEPLDEPGDWARPVATTLLLIAVGFLLGLAGAPGLGVLVALLGPFAAALVASLRGPAARVFVVVAATTTSGYLLLASL